MEVSPKPYTYYLSQRYIYPVLFFLAPHFFALALLATFLSTSTSPCTHSSAQSPCVLWQDLDHFCPWTGTTIAGKNICCFYVFITMIVVTLIFTMLVVVFSLAGHPGQYRHRYRR